MSSLLGNVLSTSSQGFDIHMHDVAALNCRLMKSEIDVMEL